MAGAETVLASHWKVNDKATNQPLRVLLGLDDDDKKPESKDHDPTDP